jgi:undecaprenyl-diphosphatase
MTALQAIVMAILQGVTELFPISSLGHAVIAPAILGWTNVDEAAPGFLPFLAVMHLGTAMALLLFFWRDWAGFAGSVLRFSDPAGAADRRLFWRVVVATIPAVVIGFFFEKALRHGFAAPKLAAVFLIVNGVMLFVADRMRRPATRALDQLTWTDALIIGFAQCLALIPGMSRSGATMAGGYLRGLDHEEAALEAPKLAHDHQSFGPLSILAGAVAGVTALISVWLLMRWFKTHEVKGFTPFAVYCWVAGAGSLAWLLSR